MLTNPDLKDIAMDLLQSKLPHVYFFHNTAHTNYVFEKVIEIGMQEHCTKNDINLLCTAALWHDMGYIISNQNHEEQSCLLVKKFLPEYGYSTEEINVICGMIMATKIPQTPKNKLEEILADADLEYLGTELAETQANQLFKELKAFNPELTLDKWNQMQIDFIEKHHYFTDYCIKNKQKKKEQYLAKIQSEAR